MCGTDGRPSRAVGDATDLDATAPHNARAATATGVSRRGRQAGCSQCRGQLPALPTIRRTPMRTGAVGSKVGGVQGCAILQAEVSETARRPARRCPRPMQSAGTTLDQRTGPWRHPRWCAARHQPEQHDDRPICRFPPHTASTIRASRSCTARCDPPAKLLRRRPRILATAAPGSFGGLRRQAAR